MTVNSRLYAPSIVWTAFLLLFIVFLTYRSFNDDIFYINWLAGLIVTGLFCLILLVDGSVKKIFIITAFICCAWLIWALLVTPYTSDVGHHLKIWFVSLFYMVCSLVFSHFILFGRYNSKAFAFVFLTSWAAINLLFFVLFFLGVYEPAKIDFSGVFHDRNVFSITTLIVIVFYLVFYADFKTKKSNMLGLFLVALCSLMILVSKSVSGFVGSGFLLFVYGLWHLSSKKVSLAFLAFVIVIGVLMTDNPVKNRVDRFVMVATGQTEKLRTNESAYIRSHLLVEGFRLGVDNIYFGVGLDNARRHVMWPERNTGSFLHNTYLDVLTSGGILLLLLYYGPVFWALSWLLYHRKKVFIYLPGSYKQLWLASVLFLSLKLLYDLAWTTYFEFAMVFSVVFAIYSTMFLRKRLSFEKNHLHQQHPQSLRPHKPVIQLGQIS